MGKIKSDGSNCGCCIFADPFQRQDLVVRGREITFIFFNDGFRCRMKISRTGIIAESLPQLHYFIIIRFSEMVNGGKSGCELMIIVHALVDPGLLKNYLRK